MEFSAREPLQIDCREQSRPGFGGVGSPHPPILPSPHLGCSASGQVSGPRPAPCTGSGRSALHWLQTGGHLSSSVMAHLGVGGEQSSGQVRANPPHILWGDPPQQHRSLPVNHSITDLAAKDPLLGGKRGYCSLELGDPFHPTRYFTDKQQFHDPQTSPKGLWILPLFSFRHFSILQHNLGEIAGAGWASSETKCCNFAP